MAYHGLAEFLETLGQAGELARVEVEVDPVLEVAEVTDRVAQSGGPALLFAAVRGHALPVLTNLLGTESRIHRACGGRTPDELAQVIEEIVQPSSPAGWLDRIKPASTRALFRASVPKTVKTGACQQVVRLGEDVDLGELPALTCHASRSGPTITAGRVFVADAESGLPSVGHHDLHVLSRDTLGVCWNPHDDPAGLVPGYRERNARMPLAVVFGGDPAGLLAAMAPWPARDDATALAGLLRGKPCELVACRDVDLQVPTDAEMVVEGYLDPAEPPCDIGLIETPGGGCRFCHRVPVMHVTAVTHRANPIVPAMVRGPAVWDETCRVREALARIFLPLARLAAPELVDYDLPVLGAVRHAAVVSIRKTYAGQARRAAHALWGLRQFMFAKLLVIVDETVDVHDRSAVWEAVLRHVAVDRDVVFAQGPPDPFDPTGSMDALAQRMAVDATIKLPGEYHGQQPSPDGRSETIRRQVTERWAEYRLGTDPLE